jgi:hypothetical protein
MNNKSPFSRLACWLGIHGPQWFGTGSVHRSSRTASFERTCRVCGAVWHGDEVEVRNVRTLGGWLRVKRHG